MNLQPATQRASVPLERRKLDVCAFRFRAGKGWLESCPSALRCRGGSAPALCGVAEACRAEVVLIHPHDASPERLNRIENRVDPYTGFLSVPETPCVHRRASPHRGGKH